MWVKGLIGMADGMLLIMVLAFLVKIHHGKTERA